MIEAKILVKHSASKCNKELLDFLHKNIKTIKKAYGIKVIVVYDDLVSKLPKKIKRLPVLILKGTLLTGNEAIFQRFKETFTNKPKPPTITVSEDLQDFWHKEMHNGGDNENPDDVIMESVKNKALETTMRRQEARPKQRRRHNSVKSNGGGNIKLDNLQSSKISDLVGDDPIMKKFWDNQESTPGFEGEDSVADAEF